MRHTQYLLLVLALLCACQKEETTIQTGSVKNATTMHTITLLFYSRGTVPANGRYELAPGQEILLGRSSQRGLSSTPGFMPDIALSGEDSLVVVYDNQYRVTHYMNVLPGTSLASKHHSYSSPRNMLNVVNYSFEKEVLKKRKWQNDHLFTFTEEDYNFARLCCMAPVND